MGELFISGGPKFMAPEGCWYDTKTEMSDAQRSDYLIQTCRWIEYRQSGIHDGHRRHAEIVLGYTPTALAWTTSTSSAVRGQVQTTKNVVRAVSDTATALIAKTMPKPTIVTDGGDWEVQTRAKDMDRFLVGSYSRAGVYPAAQMAFRDCTIYGTGAWRLVERRKDGDFWIENQRVNIDDLVVDENECMAETKPENFYHRTLVQVDKAVRLWGKGDPVLEEKIRSVAGKPVIWPGNKSVPADRVVVVEGWHVASYDGVEKGYYCAAVDGAYLDGKIWEFPWAPFVVLYWAPPLSGFYGDGVAYRQYGRQRRVNYLYRWVQRCQDLIANPRVWVDATNGPLKVQISNEIGEIISTRGREPTFQMPQAVSAEMYSWLDALERGGFEDEGISQMSAQNELPKGIESAPAQREYSFKEGSRFAPVSQRWEDAVARENAYKTLELYKQEYTGKTSRIRVGWADRKLAEIIEWDDVEMERDRYQIRVEASSLEALSPAGRLQAVIELSQTGWIEPEEGRALLGHPDLTKSNEVDTAPLDYANYVASRLLRGEVVVPNPYADLKMCQKVVKATILRAEMGKAPGRLISHLMDYMRQVDTLLAPPPVPMMGPQMQNPPGSPGLPGQAGPPGMMPPTAGPPGLPVQAITPAAATGAIPLTGPVS